MRHAATRSGPGRGGGRHRRGPGRAARRRRPATPLRPPYAVAEWWTEEVAAQRGLRADRRLLRSARLGGAAASRPPWRRREPDLQPGNVVVMHDGAEAEGESRADTVALMRPAGGGGAPAGPGARAAGRRPGVLVAAKGDPAPDPAVSSRWSMRASSARTTAGRPSRCWPRRSARARRTTPSAATGWSGPSFRVLARRRRARGRPHRACARCAPSPTSRMAGAGRRRGGAAAPPARYRRGDDGHAAREAWPAAPVACWPTRRPTRAGVARHGFRRPLEGELAGRRPPTRPRQLVAAARGPAEPFALIDDDF